MSNEDHILSNHVNDQPEKVRFDYDEDYFPDFETDSTRIPAESDSIFNPVEPDTVDSYRR